MTAKRLFPASLRALPHLALLNGLYPAALIVAITDMLGLRYSWRALLAAFLLSWATFLLDRVKPSAQLMDPADAAAHPERFAFHSTHGRWLRCAVACALTLGALVAWMEAPVLVLLAVFAPVGVLLYGTAPRGIRAKDRLSLKTPSVALAVTALSLAFAIVPGDRWRGVNAMWLALATLFVAGHVFVDAALCDIDDATTDAQHGTRTLANTIGAQPLWRFVIVMNIALGAAPVTALMAGHGPSRALWAWGVLPLATLLFIHAMRPTRVRDWIDTRLLVVATIAAALRLLG